MNATILTLLTSLTLSFGEGIRYITKPDIHDTTGWMDSHSLVANSSYSAIFMHYFDDDYYSFTSQFLRSVSIEVFSSQQTANIEVYKNGVDNSDLVASFTSQSSYNFSNSSSNLICMAPNDTLYIRVTATTTASNYSIKANTNPSYSGVSIVKDSNNNEPSTYFGYSTLTVIYYYIDTSCNIAANGNGSYTITNAYNAALTEWNKVGNLSFVRVYNQSLANVTLSAKSTSNFTGTVEYRDLGCGNYTVSNSNFSCTECSVINDYHQCLGSSHYETYLNYVSLCFHMIGHSIGLNHNNYYQNFMFWDLFGCSINPFNAIGDGDVASYLYIYG